MLVQAHPAPRTARTRRHTLPVPGGLRPTQGRPHVHRTLDRRGPARRRRPDRGRQQDFRAPGEARRHPRRGMDRRTRRRFRQDAGRPRTPGRGRLRPPRRPRRRARPGPGHRRLLGPAHDRCHGHPPPPRRAEVRRAEPDVPRPRGLPRLGARVTATEAFVAHRNLLFTVAYEMLGSAADAEDVLQETWLRWAGVDLGSVRDRRAYLVRITTRQALSRLRTVGRRRESYVGPWLPAPLLTAPGVAGGVALA